LDLVRRGALVIIVVVVVVVVVKLGSKWSRVQTRVRRSFRSSFVPFVLSMVRHSYRYSFVLFAVRSNQILYLQL
jgi:hypothetical protein